MSALATKTPSSRRSRISATAAPTGCWWLATSPTRAASSSSSAAALPIAFDGLNSNGTVYSGRTLRARFACGNAAVASVSCYVNGIRVAERVPVAGGEFSAVIPPGALTACEGEPNCVSFVAYNASGAVVARNYSLVSKVSPATVLLLR